MEQWRGQAPYDMPPFRSPPEADSVHSTPPLDASVSPLSGLAIQERERQTTLRRLTRLRKEASADIEQLIAFLDGSDPYVMTEREEVVDDVACHTDKLEVSEGDDEDAGDDEPSLGSLGPREPPETEPTLSTSTTAPSRTIAGLTWKACLSRWARRAGNWTGMSNAPDPASARPAVL
ncbi:hypothetical protein WN73_18625 [Bradyrhizobium sp. CCBAU 45394]|nr:hypothetical protein [Bradyrhizobium sp. CCBAU 45394]